MHFQQLKEIYASASDIAETVNAVYTAMLLLSVVGSFTALTHILYYILVNFIVQETSFSSKLTENESYSVWLIYSSAVLIQLVLFTAFTAKETNHNV
jgi:hypothetical protein